MWSSRGTVRKALDCLYRRGAFEKRAAGHPVLVMLDLKMPRVNSLGVLRVINADPQVSAVPVVIAR
jgi:CheY-like chemotaxis protein